MKKHKRLNKSTIDAVINDFNFELICGIINRSLKQVSLEGLRQSARDCLKNIAWNSKVMTGIAFHRGSHFTVYLYVVNGIPLNVDLCANFMISSADAEFDGK